ncbi:MAG: hypothetical protein ACRCU1_19000 [Alsobacter sp.]
MDKTTDTITGCPAHLEPALAAARARWAGGYTGDHRASQAAEVLGHASMMLSSRSWYSSGGELGAELGLWLAQTALSEEAARIARNSAPKAADLGTLTADEIALILAARKAAQ